MLAATLASKKKNNNKEKRLKTNLYMHNTWGDVALMIIGRETSYLNDLEQYQNKRSSPFLSRGMFLECSQIWGFFQPYVLIK